MGSSTGEASLLHGDAVTGMGHKPALSDDRASTVTPYPLASAWMTRCRLVLPGRQQSEPLRFGRGGIRAEGFAVVGLSENGMPRFGAEIRTCPTRPVSEAIGLTGSF